MTGGDNTHTGGTVDRGAVLRQFQSSQPHDCPACNSFRALDTMKKSLGEIETAVEGFIEQSTEFEGSYYFLLDELKSIAKSRLALPVRKRLLNTLTTAQSGRGVRS